MALSDSITAAVAVLRRHPADVLPFYLLGAAVPAIVRVVPMLAVVVGYVYLEATGRLEPIRTEIETGTVDPPDPEANPEAFDAWLQGLAPVTEQLVTPTLVVLAVLTVLVSFLVTIALFAAVAAAQLAACYGRLRGERGLIVGLDGARRYWLRFLGVYVLELVLWIVTGLAIVLGAALAGGTLAVTTGSELASALAVLPALLVALVAFASIRAVFAFAPVAVVADGASVFGSLSRAIDFIRRHPVDATFYYVISVGSLIAISTVSGVLAVVGGAEITALVGALLLFPFLDLLKTALYGDAAGRLSPPSMPERSLRRQFAAGLRTGWREMLSFVRTMPLLHAVVVAVAIVSFWAGWEVAAPFVGTFETSIAVRLEEHVPLVATLEFFGNNWTVAFTTAYGGLALAIPALVSLVFNGFVMGFYARLEVELAELVAFVVPHGLFEVPAILVACALGIWLGVIGGRALRGRATRRDVADALERAFWVVVGLGILLAVAAVIEGFVSPYYYDLFR